MKEKFNEWLFWGMTSVWLGFGCYIIWVTR